MTYRLSFTPLSSYTPGRIPAMICAHCGTENPEQAIYCIKCGKQMQNMSQPSSALTPLSTTSADVAFQTGTIETWRTAISTSTKWIRRVAIPLTTLAWIALVAVVLWSASHIGRSLILLAIAALLAVALAPAVKQVARVIPRILAILVVYLIVLIGLGIVIYF